MEKSKIYDALIIGGSYAGLSAAMALGRSLRSVLIIDSGLPCNRQTPYSHNFITHDGKTPTEIQQSAKEQVLAYKTVHFFEGLAEVATKDATHFRVKTSDNSRFLGKKLLVATGVRDLTEGIEGLTECWGISVLHCPYCHGYEVKGLQTGVLADGDMGFEFVKMISHWTPQLTLFTNGQTSLQPEQLLRLKAHNITIVETKVKSIQHLKGHIQGLKLADGSFFKLQALYNKPPFEQHSAIPKNLGCHITDMGHIEVDNFQKTTVKGVFAAGDCTTMFRSLSTAVAAGTLAGAMLNKELIDDAF